jgi:hypothetical protein
MVLNDREAEPMTSRAPRADYSAPAVVWEDVLDTPSLVAACGKMGGAGGLCTITAQS